MEFRPKVTPEMSMKSRRALPSLAHRRCVIVEPRATPHGIKLGTSVSRTRACAPNRAGVTALAVVPRIWRLQPRRKSGCRTTRGWSLANPAHGGWSPRASVCGEFVAPQTHAPEGGLGRSKRRCTRSAWPRAAHSRSTGLTAASCLPRVAATFQPKERNEQTQTRCDCRPGR